MSTKLGDVYVEIGLKTDQLKSQMGITTSEIKKQAEKFQEYFSNFKMDIDNRLMVTKFNDLKGLYRSLQVQLEQKIKLNADLASIEKTRIAINSVRNAMGNLKTATGGYNAVGVDFVRIVQDSPFFLQSMQMGVLATANNFQQLAMSVNMAVSRGLTFRQMISSMVTGMNGWMLAIQLAIAAILAFSMANRGAQEQADKFTLTSIIGELNAYQESLKNIKKELTGLTNYELLTVFDKLNKKLDETLKKVVLMQTIAIGGGVGTGLLNLILGNNPDELQNKLNQIIDTIILATEETNKRIGNNKAWNYWNKQVQDLTEKIKAGDMGLIPSLRAAEAELKKIDDLIKGQAGIDAAKAWEKKMKAIQESSTKLAFKGLDIGGTLSGGEVDTTVPKESKTARFLELINKSGGDVEDLLNKINKDTQKGITLQQNYFSQLATGFTQAIFGANSLLDSFKRLTMQMAEMVAQALFFEAIWSIFNPTTKSGGIFEGLFGRVTAPQSPLSPQVQPIGNSFSFNDSNIVNAINGLNNRISVNQAPATFRIVWNNKEIGRMVQNQNYIDNTSNYRANL